MHKKRYPKTTRKKIVITSRQRKIFIFSVIGIILFVFFLKGPRGTIEFFRTVQKKNELQEEIEHLKKTKAGLDSEKVKLNEDEYIEKIAREQYNMKKQGETIYKIKKDSN
jgi:cell division protein FtsB